jgi:magnesium-transporting ATPase (P-type)
VAWHAVDAAQALERLGSDAGSGLSAQGVAMRSAHHGPNALPEAPQRSALLVFLRQFKSPLIYILFVAAALAAGMGHFSDSGVILGVVIVNALIGAFQEGRAERSMAALRRLSALRVRVVRDGREHAIPARELVPGDVLLLGAGDAVGADARLLDAAALAAAEAALTGESVPVAKHIGALPESTSLADRSNMVFSGTYITAGRARAVVTTTGTHTEVGRIAHLTASAEEPKTPLELRIEWFGRYLVGAALLLFAAVMSLGLLRGLGVGDVVLVAISQMVSMVPEGLPVAMTIALAVGMQRMAGRGAIIRRLSAVETLGSITVICSDKTGTLTRNQMTVSALWLPGGRSIDVSGVGYAPRGVLSEGGAPVHEADAALRALLHAAVLCNDAELVAPPDELTPWAVLGDPTEAALLVAAAKFGVDVQRLRQRAPRQAELPFDSDSKMMATRHADGATPHRVLIKGAPGEGFGRATLLGLIGQIDPPREEVKAAVAQCRAAGIRPMMITGDHKLTGLAIARELGIAREGGPGVAPDRAVDGTELEAMSAAELHASLPHIAVFARVHPAQKLRIVAALQARGDVVAMTGDGVNDAPALARADVGVAMGITGTEVAKSAARIVITDDNFATIVGAVEQGRVVYANLKKVILFLFVTSIDEVLLLLLALFLGYRLPLSAVQILWINIVTESTLTVNLVMEPPEGDEMQRPPVRRDDRLLSVEMLRRVALLVPAAVAATFGWFVWRQASGVPFELVRTETFTVLAMCQWFNVLNCQSATRSALRLSILRNPWLLGGLALSVLLQTAVLYWLPLIELFGTEPIAPADLACLVVVASSVLWTEELRKVFARRSRAETQ